MSLLALADSLERFADDLDALPQRVAGACGQIVLQAVLRYSHGPFSTEYLGTLYDPYGPYSVRDPHPPNNPGIVNYQSGLFAKSWTQVVVKTPNLIRVTTWNEAPYARDLEDGTSRMIARDLPNLVVHTTQGLVAGAAQKALPAL